MAPTQSAMKAMNRETVKAVRGEAARILCSLIEAGYVDEESLMTEEKREAEISYVNDLAWRIALGFDEYESRAVDILTEMQGGA